MPPKGYKKPKPEPIVETPVVVAPHCGTCPAFSGGHNWGKCRFYPTGVEKFYTDWCMQHPDRKAGAHAPA